MSILSTWQQQLLILGLGIQAASVYFLWKTICVSEPEVQNMASGAIIESEFSIYGVRWPLTRMLLRNQYLSLNALLILLIGIVIQMLGTAFDAGRLSPIQPLVFSLVSLGLLCIALGVAKRFARVKVKKRIFKAVEDQVALWRNRGMHPDQAEKSEIHQEVKYLCDSDYSNSDRARVDELLNTL